MLKKKQQSPRRLDAPIYSYWQAFYLSLFSRQLYVDVAKRWCGVGFFYLLLLLAILVIPLSARIIIEFNHFFDEKIIAPLNQIPPLSVHNGNVVFDKPMPYFIKNKSGAIVVVIDTAGSLKRAQDIYPELMMLITKNKLYFRTPNLKLFNNSVGASSQNHFSVQRLGQTVSEIFVVSTWIKSSGIVRLKWLGCALVYPFMLSVSFGALYAFLLIFAMPAQVFSWLIFKFRLSFKEAARLLIVASTAQLTVFFIVMSVNAVPLGLGLFCFAMSAVYFSYAALSVKRESNRLVRL